jgi:hypothetical protein
VANPGAGNELTITVTAGQVWELQGLFMTFTTDATVSNRVVSLLVDDGTNVFAQSRQSVAQAASLSRNFTAGPVGAFWASQSEVANQFPLADMFLPAGYRLRTSTQNKQAGDTYTAIVISYRQYAS